MEILFDEVFLNQVKPYALLFFQLQNFRNYCVNVFFLYTGPKRQILQKKWKYIGVTFGEHSHNIVPSLRLIVTIWYFVLFAKLGRHRLLNEEISQITAFNNKSFFRTSHISGASAAVHRVLMDIRVKKSGLLLSNRDVKLGQQLVWPRLEVVRREQILLVTQNYVYKQFLKFVPRQQFQQA